MAVSSIGNGIFSLIASGATSKSSAAVENAQKTTSGVNKSANSWSAKVTISSEAREAARRGPSMLSIEAFLEGRDERVYVDVENAEATAKKQIEAYVGVHPETPPEVAEWLYYHMRQFNISSDPVASAYNGQVDLTFLSNAQQERKDYLENKIKTDPVLRDAMDIINSRDIPVESEMYLLIPHQHRLISNSQS